MIRKNVGNIGVPAGSIPIAMASKRFEPDFRQTENPDFIWIFCDAYFAKASTFVSRFVKDVRTLADAGELTEMLTAVREVSQHMNAASAKNAA